MRAILEAKVGEEESFASLRESVGRVAGCIAGLEVGPRKACAACILLTVLVRDCYPPQSYSTALQGAPATP